MKLHEIQIPEGSRTKRKRVGRGESSGWGRTSGRGNKGQGSRAGGKKTKGFEGGQMPLKRRLPKRGFNNPFKKKFALLNVKDLERFEGNAVIDPETLLKQGLIKKLYDGVKILGKGELTKPLTVKVNHISAQAKAKIEKAGGKIEVF